MPRSDRGVTARELALLVVGACLVSVVMNWPLVLHLGHDIPNDLGDPLAESWQAAWDGHALAHQPLHFFDSNQFWPFGDTLAFSDALVGYAPAGLIGSGPHAAVVRYDLLFLFAYSLAFVGAYLLARELGLAPAGAAVVGAAFAFAPFRLEQDGHMQIISSGGIPLALALAVRGYRRRRGAWVIAGGIVAAWQLSIGFNLGLPFAYLIAALGVIGGLVWLRLGRPGLDRRLVVATLIGALLFAGAAFALSRPYVHVADAHRGAKRTPEEVEAFSGPVSVFLVAPEDNLIWGGATDQLRAGLGPGTVSEKTLFPGLVIVLLAIAGLTSAAHPRWLRWGLGAGVLAISVLALGFRAGGGILWPYRVLYDLLPGWQAIRVPGRLVTFSSLGLALLAGIGAQRLIAAFATRPSGRRHRAGGALAVVLVLAIVIEGRGLPFDPFDNLAQPKVPPNPPSVASVPAPQLHLPAKRATDNRRYILWSTDGFPKLVNGRSSLNPAFTTHLIGRTWGFPDRHSVAVLSRLGVRSVILHTNRVKGTPWQGAARRPVTGLGVRRRRLGELLVYEIRSNLGSATTKRPGPSSARRSR
jgi:hypothetical protein